MLLYVTGRHVLHVMVGSLIPHVPHIPRDMFRVDFLSIRKFVGFRDYLLHGFVSQNLLSAEVANLHRFL